MGGRVSVCVVVVGQMPAHVGRGFDHPNLTIQIRPPNVRHNVRITVPHTHRSPLPPTPLPTFLSMFLSQHLAQQPALTCRQGSHTHTHTHTHSHAQSGGPSRFPQHPVCIPTRSESPRPAKRPGGNTLHCTTLHCTTFHCTTLHCTTLQCNTLHRARGLRSDRVAPPVLPGPPRPHGKGGTLCSWLGAMLCGGA